MKEKNDSEKLCKNIAIYILIVFAFYIMGQIFPPITQTQPKYDVWESQNWIIHLPTDKIYYYEIQVDENGTPLFYIESGEEHFAHCQIKSNSMVLSGTAINHREQYREMFDVLFSYYDERLEVLVKQVTDL